MLQMIQQQNADAAMAAKQRFRQQRKDDMRAQQDAQVAFQRTSQLSFKTLTHEVVRVSAQRHKTARPTAIKLPIFDLEKDRSTLKQWGIDGICTSLPTSSI
jgi:hypothetical protein